MLEAVTARMSSSVCKLPFISRSPSAAWIIATAFAAAVSLSGASINLKLPISSLCSRATALINRRGADQDRRYDPNLCCLGRGAKRCLVAGIDNDRFRRGHALCPRDQAVVFRLRQDEPQDL